MKDILSFEVKNKNSELIRLENVLNIEETAEAKELNRYNKMRSITLSAGLSNKYSLGDGIYFLEKLSKNKLQGNYKIDFMGQSKNLKNLLVNFIFYLLFH